MSSMAVMAQTTWSALPLVTRSVLLWEKRSDWVSRPTSARISPMVAFAPRPGRRSLHHSCYRYRPNNPQRETWKQKQEHGCGFARKTSNKLKRIFLISGSCRGERELYIACGPSHALSRLPFSESYPARQSKEPPARRISPANTKRRTKLPRVTWPPDVRFFRSPLRVFPSPMKGRPSYLNASVGNIQYDLPLIQLVGSDVSPKHRCY